MIHRVSNHPSPIRRPRHAQARKHWRFMPFRIGQTVWCGRAGYPVAYIVTDIEDMHLQDAPKRRGEARYYAKYAWLRPKYPCTPKKYSAIRIPCGVSAEELYHSRGECDWDFINTRP